MTECERLLAEGFFKEEFFQEEIICDYRVSVELKKIWAIELDMLRKLDEICKKHHLRYFLFFGSLLGAVRHHGFIPWDDDMDVVMYRDDYMQLLELKDEFSFPYFLQTPITDPGSGYSFAKIRNSNTSAVCNKFRFEKFNQGIFLDIFPLDEWNSKDVVESFERINKLNIDNSTMMRISNPYLDANDRARVNNYCGKSILENYQKIQDIAMQYRSKGGDCLSTIVTTIYPKVYILSKEDFAKTIITNLYGIDCPIPFGYDSLLTMVYGDWRRYPPIEKRGINHDGCFFNADQPYTKILV